MTSAFVAPLLATKFAPPRLKLATLVRRGRLLDSINQVGEACLILVSAPAGFGKTTLIFEWLASIGAQAAWLTLDERDNDPVQFWRYIVGALHQGGILREGLAANLVETSQPPPALEIASSLINDLAEAGSAESPPGLLVLDDYQVINNPKIHESLNYFLDYLPGTLRMVIATRSDPPLQLPRRRARREVSEIRAYDLRFTVAEARELLNEILKLDLTRAEIEVLAQRTEGWVAGLQLAAISLGEVPDRSQFIEKFAGDDRYVADYLVGEVLQRRPADIQTFLLQTSVLDRLSPDLCDALTGGHDARAILRTLEDENLFITPLDNRRIWYRYHRLFGDLLRERLLEQSGESGLRALYLQASRWSAEHNELDEAFEYAIKAGDHAWTISLCERFGPILFVSSRLAQLTIWMRKLPRPVLEQQPRMLFMLAWGLLATGEPDQVEPYLQAVENYYHMAASQIPERGSQEAVTMDPERLAALIEVAVVRSNLAINSFALDNILDWGNRVLPYLTNENQPYVFNTMYDLRPPVLFMLGLANKFLGNSLDADQLFEEAQKLSREQKNIHIFVLATANLAEAQILQGQLTKAEKTSRFGLAFLEKNGSQISPFTGMIYVLLGNLAYEWNDLADSRKQFETGISRARVWRHWESIVGGYAGLVRVCLAQDQLSDAQNSILELKQYLEETGGEFMLPAVNSLQAQLDLARGDLAAVGRWVATLNFDQLDPIPYLLENEMLITARYLMARGDWSAADQLLSRIRVGVEGGGRVYRLICLQILGALLLEHTSKPASAEKMLQSALELAEPAGCVRIFLDEDQALVGVLYRLIQAGEGQAYAARLLAEFEADQEQFPRHTEPMQPASKDLIEPLSERELEVLLLLNEGLANKEIAAQLMISITTVKTHIQNIYAKLGVNNRTQAVARARLLGILQE